MSIAMIKWTERLEDGLFLKSRSMAAPWGPILRVLRFPIALVRDWLKGEINVRAMSLAYTTLLSLVPLMVLSFSVMKGLGTPDNLRYLLHQFLAPVGGAADDLTASIMEFVTNMRGDVLGSIGLAFLVYTVISTIEKIEASFNFVWRVENPRSFARRFSQYLSVIIVGPVLLAVALGLLASASESPFARWLDAIPPLARTFSAIGELVPYLVVTVAFTCMYALVPNTRVRPAAAIIGGLTAGVIWALVGRLFTTFILYSSHLIAVYTGFAIVLTTLLWVYMSWLVLLIGADLAFYVQAPQYLRHGHERADLTGSAREQAGLAVMYLIGRDYAKGGPYWTANRLADALDVPGIALTPVLRCLERGGLLVATEKEQYVPARDLAGIELASIIDAVRTRQSGRLAIVMRSIPAAAGIMGEIETALSARLEGRSVKDLIGADTQSPPEPLEGHVTRP